jgi:hypothetical protein
VMGLTTGLTIGSYVHCIIYAAMVVATNWELQVRLYPPARKQREAQPPQREVFRSAGVLTRPAGCSETRHDRVLGHHQLPQLKLHSQYREGANTPSAPRLGTTVFWDTTSCRNSSSTHSTGRVPTRPAGCSHDRVLGHHQLPQLKLHSQYREGANTPSWVLRDSARPCSGTPPAAATQAPLTLTPQLSLATGSSPSHKSRSA